MAAPGQSSAGHPGGRHADPVHARRGRNPGRAAAPGGRAASGRPRWTQILDDAEFLERLAQGFLYLGNCGVPAPDEIGFEHEEGDDYRVAEALWEQARLVFLTSAQMECAESWKSAGYAVIEEAENWWLAVESALKGQTP